jgi:tetratricopeptide (TPR) repeat protein
MEGGCAKLLICMLESKGGSLVRILTAVVAALIMAQSWPATARDTTAPAAEQRITPEGAAAALAEAVQRARNNDARGIIAALRPVIGSPAFATLTEVQRYWVCALLGSALYQTEDYAGAMPLLRQATEFGQASGNDWRMRFWGALAVNDYADAVGSVATLARRWPITLNTISSRTVRRLRYNMRGRPDEDALTLQLLQALHRAGWRPQNEPIPPDHSFDRVTLSRLLLDRGDANEAQRVAQDVQHPLAIATMMIDRRYDAVMRRSPGELPALFETHLGRVRAEAAAHSDRLEAANRLADALFELDRGEEALAVLDAAIERAGSTRESGRRFQDQDDALNWTRNHRAWALLSLGRGDEAAAEMARGARHPENGDVNVSQLINLGEVYLRIGRSAEAVDALTDLDLGRVSGYGWMNAHYVLACAKREMGLQAEADAVLAAMRARGDDSGKILRGTDLCFDHFEEAAQLFIQDLDDPEEREEALLEAQTYIEPRHQTAFQRRMTERRRTLLARPDVRAAVERHGRIIALPIRPTNY